MSYPDDWDLATGSARGWTSDDKFGRNSLVGTSFVPLCNGGIYRTPQPSGATALRVKAGNAADTNGGAGAWSVRVFGMGADGELVDEILTTAGASAGPAGVVEFIRIFRAFVYESGTYADQTTFSHTGEIVIENAAGTEDWCIIANTDLSRSQSQIGALTVPKGYEMYITGSVISVESTKVANITLFKREGILDASPPYQAMRVQEEYVGIGGEFTHPHKPPIGPFHELTDIGFLAKVSGQTGDISVTFDYVYRKVS